MVPWLKKLLLKTSRRNSMDEIFDDNMDIFGSLNWFAQQEGLIDKFGSYAEAVNNDIDPDKAVQLVNKLYGILQKDYEVRLSLAEEALLENRFETYGFNDFEIANIINRLKDNPPQRETLI